MINDIALKCAFIRKYYNFYYNSYWCDNLLGTVTLVIIKFNYLTSSYDMQHTFPVGFISTWLVQSMKQILFATSAFSRRTDTQELWCSQSRNSRTINCQVAQICMSRKLTYKIHQEVTNVSLVEHKINNQNHLQKAVKFV